MITIINHFDRTKKTIIDPYFTKKIKNYDIFDLKIKNFLYMNQSLIRNFGEKMTLLLLFFVK